jgi:hypothetical protein
MSLRLTLNPEKNPFASLRLGVINFSRQGAKAQKFQDREANGSTGYSKTGEHIPRSCRQ